jgi:hypothetical protein
VTQDKRQSHLPESTKLGHLPGEMVFRGKRKSFSDYRERLLFLRLHYQASTHAHGVGTDNRWETLLVSSLMIAGKGIS